MSTQPLGRQKKPPQKEQLCGGFSVPDLLRLCKGGQRRLQHLLGCGARRLKTAGNTRKVALEIKLDPIKRNSHRPISTTRSSEVNTRSIGAGMVSKHSVSTAISA